jgi:hypothetical protein
MPLPNHCVDCDRPIVDSDHNICNDCLEDLSEPTTADEYNEEKVISKEELFMWQAPSFNFELSEDELLQKAIDRGFVKKIGDNKYKVNKEY